MRRLKNLFLGIAFAVAVVVTLDSPASTREYYSWGEYYKSTRLIGGGGCTDVSPTSAPPGCSTLNGGPQCSILIGMTRHYIFERNFCVDPLKREQ